MASDRDATVATVDIVCGTLHAKLHTRDLSSGSSPCVLFGSRLLTPCDFQCLAGRASARNWKVTIRYLDQPLSNFLESYSNTDGKCCCRFVDSTSDSTPYRVSANLRQTQANSQLPDGSDIPPVALVDAVTHSQPLVSDSSSSNNQSPSQFSESDTQPSTDLVPSQSLDPVDLPSSVQPPLLDHTTSDFQLPTFQPVAEPTFVWGTMDSANFIHSLDAAYSDVTHWIKNCFVVPRCSAGRAFVSELARLFRSVGEGSALESIALKAIIVICALLLQKPARNSKERDHIRHLERCLTLWKEGALDELLCEGRVIQSRLKHAPSARKGAQIIRSFTKLMFEGNTRAALQLLTGHGQGGVLNLNDPADPSNPEFSVRDALRAKHPPAQPLLRECLSSTVDTPAVHPIVFDTLDASVVRAAALRTVGAAGPSGIDAGGW